ncbi:MAG TPA: phosphomannomutase/phosphoglucomutase, partial [Candidatus Woesearchaeota archaeon]|nr:phosphomannomutase/phosphoglucomutase [Candidatus Woesearchaeota archaeon]
YNGFKLCREKAIPISGDSGLKEIENLVNKNDFNPAEDKGKISKVNILDEYIDHLLKHKLNACGLKVVVDTANAMGGLTIPRLLKKVDCKAVQLFPELDGNFPNHEANPLKHETLKALQETVIKEKADFGVAFDGDADRCGFVDEKGDIINCDLITALIADYFLEKKQGQKILFDVRSSKAVGETISEKGGIPIVWKIGHSFIKEKMRAEDVVFAGEISGHYYFKDETGFYAESDGLPLLIVMDLICEKKKPLSELIRPFKRYFSSGEINMTVKDKDLVLKAVEEKFKDAEISKLDGISVKYPDWWFNLRASNTEPLLRLNLEARSKSLMEEKRDEVLDFIKSL